MGSVDPRFAHRLREILRERGISFRALAARTFYAKSYLHDLASGRKPPTAEAAVRLDDALGAGGELAGYVVERGEELDALELAQRVAASDISHPTFANQVTRRFKRRSGRPQAVQRRHCRFAVLTR